MVYLGILDLGANEFGPVNNEEMAYVVFTLITSALLNTLIFGDVTSLILIISKRGSEQ